MEELSRFRVSADLGSNDGRLSVALKPNGETNSAPSLEAGVLIHFETVVENGSSKLNVFTSLVEDDTQAASTSTRSSSSTDVSTSGLYAGVTSLNTEADPFGFSFENNVSSELGESVFCS